MFDRLKNLLRGRSAGPQPAAASFAESQIFFLCLPGRFANGIPTNSSPEELLAYLEAAAEDLASSQGYEPFSYDEAGQRVLPLFTSEDHAQQFAQAWVVGRQRIIPFQVLGVQGRTLVAAVRAHDEVIMNPGTPDAVVLRSRNKSAVGRLADTVI